MPELYFLRPENPRPSMSLSRTFQRISLTILSITLPVTAFGAQSLTTKDNALVSRGDFLRAVIVELGIPVDMKAVPMETYKPLIPQTYKPYVRIAEDYSAMIAFKKNDASLRTSITRGEAAVILMKLRNMKPSGSKLSFSDVKGIEDAAQLAVEQGWMKPVRTSLFGSARTLTGREAKSILAKLTGTPSTETTPSTKANAQSIKVQYKTQKAIELPQNDLLRTVWQLLNKQYLYNTKIDSKEAGYKAAEAIVNSLNDPYTVFMRPADAKSFQEQFQGEISGIGAQVEYVDNALTVVAPITGSPAEKAGVRAGDRIIKVNGETLANLSLIQAVDKIRGPKGTSVKLTILRNGSELDIDVTRDTVRLPEIDISTQDGIAIVRLVQFGQTTDTQLRALMTQVQTTNPKGLILDLRNNPGGLLHAAEITLSNFLPEGSAVAIIKSASEEFTEVTADKPTIDEDIPMVVLVNKGSASASEIVAGALQDHKRAIIVGEKTFGKGTVQQIIEFSDGSSMKMTIAEWMTPKGRVINKNGTEPDVPVAAGDDTRDMQLLKALDLLR
jgi:carboxyl-terminal processing protease